MKTLNEKILNKHIKSVIKETLLKEKIKKVVLQEARNMILEKDGKKTKSTKNDAKLKSVVSALKDPKYNHAQLAYSLYKPKDQSEKDTYRSLFSKKVHNKPDSDGNIRKFNTEEINKLYQLINKK